MKLPWQRPKRFRHSAHFEGVLGTSLELQVVASTSASGPQAEMAALAEIDRLEAIFNAYHPASELRRWQASHGEDIAVSPELAQILSEAEAWRKSTGGVFNPAVEGLTRLWADCAQASRVPSSDEISVVLEQMNGALWEVDVQNLTARRLTKLPVTLNAIAKSFIVDRACAAAVTENVQEALINIGGDIRHMGRQAVTIAIADPHHDAENSVPADRVQIRNQGVATSGNYRRGFWVGDRWYSHVLDPRTGWPVESLVGVSVLARNATTADVLATAFNVLEPEASIMLADSLDDVGVLLIAADGTRFSNTVWEGQRA